MTRDNRHEPGQNDRTDRVGRAVAFRAADGSVASRSPPADDAITNGMLSMTHRKLILLAVLSLAVPTTALADAIDGNWCSADGHQMTINGDDITTPGGK